MKNYGLINQVVSGHGGFNYIVTLLAKNNKEFNKNSLKIFSKVGGSLRNYALFIVTDVYYAPHKYLFENKQFKQRKYGYEKQTKDVKYKKIDLKILSELSENARITNMELAKKFKISRSQVKYKIDRMEKFGLIQAYQPVLNTGKLGYEWFNLCFNIKNISKEEEKKFINFLKSMPSVNYIAKGIGRWNLVLGIHIKGMQQSHTIKDKIISEFPKIIRSYEYTYITKEHKCNFFPQAIFSKS